MISGPLFSISYGWLGVSRSWHSQVSAAITCIEVGLGCGPYQCLLKLGIRKHKKVRGSKWGNMRVVQMGEQNLQSKAVPGRGDYSPLLWLVLRFVQWMSNEKCVKHPTQMGFWESMAFTWAVEVSSSLSFSLPSHSHFYPPFWERWDMGNSMGIYIRTESYFCWKIYKESMKKLSLPKGWRSL